jgi:DNA-binding transcriptional regulator YiaG
MTVKKKLKWRETEEALERCQGVNSGDRHKSVRKHHVMSLQQFAEQLNKTYFILPNPLP